VTTPFPAPSATAWPADAEAIFALALPESWGGAGRGALAACDRLEALGRQGVPRGILLGMAAHLFGVALPLAAFATPAQAARWSAPLRCGTAIGALAVTEPEGGSSFEAMRMQARPGTGGGVVLDGEKTLVCNGAIAGLFLVLARHFPDRGALGLTAFLIPRDTPGLHVEKLEVAALPGAAMARLVLQGCEVPEEAVLGRAGAGLRIFTRAMRWERACLLSGWLGAAERDLDRCLAALGGRAGGAPLRHQAVLHRLARMRLRLDAARLLMRRGAEAADAAREDAAAAAMAKLAVSEALVECAQDTARLLAGAGWRLDPFDAAAAVAETIGGLFASGTSEVQLDTIARQMLAERRVA
jgi:clorobiocin biosynthesis protein CloN3